MSPRTTSAWALLVALSLPAAFGQQRLTQGAAVTLTSNSNNNTLAAIIDNADNTAWQSGANFPYGFVTRPDMNILLQRCAAGSAACTASAGSASLAGATDGSTTSAAASLALASGQAWLRVALPGAPLPLRRILMRPIVGSAPISVTLETAGGGTIAAGAILSNQSYSWVALVAASGPWQDVVAIRMDSATKFTVTELAATSGPSFEQATVDLGNVQPIGAIRVRHWPGGDGLTSQLLYSLDGTAFQLLQELNPATLGAVTLPQQQPPLSARYLAVRHTVKENDWAKVYVWGIDAYAPLSSPPPPPPSPPPPSPPPPSPVYAPGEWNPRAGTVESMAHGKPVTVSTAPNNNVQHITDSNDNTQWQSDACFPTGYTVRDDMNPIRGACAQAGRCSGSDTSSGFAQATDQDVYTGAYINRPPGAPAGEPAAYMTVALPAAAKVTRATLKGFGTAPVEMLLVKADGSSVKALTMDPATQNYLFVNTDGEWEGVTSVRVQSTAGFTLTEVAVQAGPCLQWATVDMGEVKQVGMLRVRFWSPDAAETSLLISSDGNRWIQLEVFNPSTLPPVDVWLDQLTPVRFIQVQHLVTNKKPWGKVYMWEIAAYDQFGRWGPPPEPVPQTRTFRQLLGVNGIWGWGMKNESAAALYTEVASVGRNYQNLNWDVRNPQNDPKFNTMAKTGTDAMWWLDWDRQYRAWQKAGMRVVVSWQFLAEDQPPDSWGPDPYTTAYKLGKAFASHFGPTNGTNTVSAVEFGNEPWVGYNATFYSVILAGFIAGAKAGDPALKRLPCALQADNPYGEDSNNGHFIGARVSPAVAPDIDVINVHSYSFYTRKDGVRVSVHPEHRGGSFNSLNNLVAWRNNNMPGKPIWVTEWGWDALLPGETCNGTECVSQHQQAVYAIRGLMLLARKGFDQTMWFFYANGDDCSATTLFCRSGLRGSNSTGYPILPVYRAFRGFLQLAGSTAFKAVLSETRELYAYSLADPATGAPTHILAWRPVETGEAPAQDVPATVQLALGNLMGARPEQAWTIHEEDEAGWEAVAGLPQVAADGKSWSLTVSPVPLLIKLA